VILTVDRDLLVDASSGQQSAVVRVERVERARGVLETLHGAAGTVVRLANAVRHAHVPHAQCVALVADEQRRGELSRLHPLERRRRRCRVQRLQQL